MKRIEEIILKNTDKPLRLTIILVTPLIVLFTLLISVFYIWDHNSRHRHLALQLKETARAHYEQVVLARLWNTRHGGVYVETNESTPPNPYLTDPDKTIVTQNGKQYSKLNPAYMTRQLSELTDEHMAFKLRITGFDPINPSNAPDPWEEEVLRSFQNGKTEGYGVTKLRGKNYFRYMAPLLVEPECLRCHAGEDYRVGEIKGGISVSIPTGIMNQLEENLDRRSLIGFGTIGGLAIFLLIGITWYSTKRLGEGLRKEFEAERLHAAVKISGAAAHELRQPMTIISGFSEIMKDKVGKGEDVTEEAEIIIGQCNRMNAIITKMLNVTTYRTKSYDETSEIFDLGLEDEERGKGDLA